MVCTSSQENGGRADVSWLKLQPPTGSASFLGDSVPAGEMGQGVPSLLGLALFSMGGSSPMQMNVSRCVWGGGAGGEVEGGGVLWYDACILVCSIW